MNDQNSTHINSLYEREKQKINTQLQNLFKKKRPKSLYSSASYILKNGGKRIRPMLVLFSAKAVGGSFEKVKHAAIAVELLHSFSLVHDDIMDNADKRRNLLTLHKKYDLSTAILAGDSLLSIAYQELLKDLSNKAKTSIEIFTKALIEVCEGQGYDKDFETNKNVSIADYKFMIKKKTAALTEMCCHLGAILGGGKEEQINSLKLFGRYIGFAFQIRDDLLDIAAEENKFGKVLGGDLIEGKKTFLLLKALELAKGNDKKLLIKLIKDKGTSTKNVIKYKDIYLRLGILELTEKEIKRNTDKALEQLNCLKDREKETLVWLADHLLNRNN
ncbi:MAG: polyprenyl synthetase family protein [Bacteroidetes bacterium]|nr:polyprenyl synthetase family protein [Bacteroidota bacterium]MCH8941725.1 polyprenyl synthetase family protein [Bacteroidota bacterium]